jgi:hypothetical protein
MFVSERGEIHVELESDVERRVRGRKWERKMSAGIDMSSGRRARCLSHPRFFAAHGMGMVFSSGEEEMGSGKRYKEEHIWSSKIDSFNNSIHHNTPHTHSHHTHTRRLFVSTNPHHIANMLFAALLAVLPALAQAGSTISGHATV